MTDKNYIIRKLNADECDKIAKFINDKWQKGHSLSKSKLLLDFQYLCDNKYNWYACFENEEIVASFGYITTRTYDSSIIYNDAWGAIWKNASEEKGIGKKLVQYVMDSEASDSLGGIGASEYGAMSFHELGLRLGEMNFFYMLNNNCKTQVVSNGLKDSTIQTGADGWSITVSTYLIDKEDVDKKYYPYKSLVYLKNRYERHPFYRYLFWYIRHEGRLETIWITRRTVANDTSVLHIVDMYGRIDEVPCLTEQILAILINESCEYVDCVNFGIKECDFERIGFLKHDVSSKDEILPYYFEPFDQRNVRKVIAYKCRNDEYVAFKGDGDQDKPNIL